MTAARATRRGALRATVAGLIRRGNRTVMLTPSPGPRFGNYLYYWLHAHIRQECGDDLRVQAQNVVAPWLAQLPALAGLSVPTGGVRPWDRRVWPATNHHQAFGSDFSATQLDRFIRHRLLDSPLLARADQPSAGTVVVNVRRGDYYSVPKFAQLFAFDIAAYLAIAVERVRARGPIERIHVVSDDPRWCREALDTQLRAVAAHVDYRGCQSPEEDFATIAGATRLIGTNSTFSYWGATPPPPASRRRTSSCHDSTLARFLTAAPTNSTRPGMSSRSCPAAGVCRPG